MQTTAPSGRIATARTVAGSRRLDLRRMATVGLFLLPATAVYSLFVLFPLVQAGYYGLYRWKGLGPLQDYVGLGNFDRVLQDDVFRSALQHNLVITVLSLTVQLPLRSGSPYWFGAISPDVRSSGPSFFFRTSSPRSSPV